MVVKIILPSFSCPLRQRRQEHFYSYRSAHVVKVSSRLASRLTRRYVPVRLFLSLPDGRILTIAGEQERLRGLCSIYFLKANGALQQRLSHQQGRARYARPNQRRDRGP